MSQSGLAEAAQSTLVWMMEQPGGQYFEPGHLPCSYPLSHKVTLFWGRCTTNRRGHLFPQRLQGSQLIHFPIYH